MRARCLCLQLQPMTPPTGPAVGCHAVVMSPAWKPSGRGHAEKRARAETRIHPSPVPSGSCLQISLGQTLWRRAPPGRSACSRSLSRALLSLVRWVHCTHGQQRALLLSRLACVCEPPALAPDGQVRAFCLPDASDCPTRKQNPSVTTAGISKEQQAMPRAGCDSRRKASWVRAGHPFSFVSLHHPCQPPCIRLPAPGGRRASLRDKALPPLTRLLIARPSSPEIRGSTSVTPMNRLMALSCRLRPGRAPKADILPANRIILDPASSAADHGMRAVRPLYIAYPDAWDDMSTYSPSRSLLRSSSATIEAMPTATQHHHCLPKLEKPLHPPDMTLGHQSRSRRLPQRFPLECSTKKQYSGSTRNKLVTILFDHAGADLLLLLVPDFLLCALNRQRMPSCRLPLHIL